MADSSTPDPGFVRSLGAGLAILECFLAKDQQSFTFSELKTFSGIKHATFARSLKLLHEWGYLHKREGVWQLGRRTLELGAHALDAETLRQRCRGVLIALMKEAHARTELHVRRAGGFVLIELHDPVHNPGLRFDIGKWRPSILNSPVDQLLAAYGDDASAHGPELTPVRKQGWASCDVASQGDKNGVFRAVAPVLDITGQCIAALAVAVPGKVTATRRKQLISLVCSHANSIPAEQSP